MKFFKLLFSRVFFIGVSIILQILLFIYANIRLNEISIIISYVSWFLSFGILLYIINQKKPDSFKLPWAILVLLLPIVGITIYLLIGIPYLPKKVKKSLNKQTEKYKIENDKYEKNDVILKNEDNVSFRMFSYIKNECGSTYFDKCYTKYLSDGEVFFQSLLEELNKAEKYIFLEYFIIEKGIMWNEILNLLVSKVKKGVKVYVIYDDMGCINKLPSDYVYTLRNLGIYAIKFNPLNPIVSFVHNNRDHRKITVIDGKVGFIGGINLADEYINKITLYGHWKDTALLIKGKAVDNLVRMFINMFNLSKYNNLEYDEFIVKEHVNYKQKGYIAPYYDSPLPFEDNYLGQNIYLNMINNANEKIVIVTPYFIVDYSFLEAIINASKRGVEVILITPHIPDKKVIKIMTKSNYELLLKNNVKIYEYKEGFVHAKMCMVDSKYVVIGTINFDYRSFVHHFECGCYLYNCNSINDMEKDINKLIKNESISMNLENSKLKWYERLIKGLLALFAPLM